MVTGQTEGEPFRHSSCRVTGTCPKDSLHIQMPTCLPVLSHYNSPPNSVHRDSAGVALTVTRGI